MYASRLELVELLENYLTLLQSQYGDHDKEITRIKLWLWAIAEDQKEQERLFMVELKYLNRVRNSRY